MQDHYNLIYREEEREMIPFCLDQGIGVIPFSPLARGILARAEDPAAAKAKTVRSQNDPLMFERYDSPNDRDVLAALRGVANARGESPAKVAMAWLLAKPGVTAPIVGATKLDHLQTAIDALTVRLSDDEMKALESPYRPHEVRGH